MVWTPPLNPDSERRDALRVLVGDVLATDPQIQDEGLAYFLAKYPDDDDQCAVYVCLAIAGSYGRQVNSSAGPVKVEAERRQAHYLTLAQTHWNLWQGLPPDGKTAGGVASLDPTALDAAVGAVAGDTVAPFFTRAWPP